MKKILIFLIRIYQKTLSPDHGLLHKVFPHGFCRYQPTCSQYTVGTIEKYGAMRGALMGFWRVVRCNPWSKGGMDEPAKAKSVQALYGLLALLIYIGVFFVLLLVFTKLMKGA